MPAKRTQSKTPRNGPLEMVFPSSFKQEEDQRTHPNINSNMNLQNPISVGLEPPSQSTYSDNDQHLRHARQTFQLSSAGIMGPPPRPNPPAQRTVAHAASTERTVYAQLLEGHQNEILRLEGELKAEKVKSAGLEAKLKVAEDTAVAAQKDAGAAVGAKRRKVGGRRTC
jgi:hypothetical protein